MRSGRITLIIFSVKLIAINVIIQCLSWYVHFIMKKYPILQFERPKVFHDISFKEQKMVASFNGSLPEFNELREENTED